MIQAVEKAVRLRIAAQPFFIKETGQEPQRRIVKAYYAIYVVTGIAVIPGTAAAFFQIHAGGVFYGEDTQHIDQPAGHSPAAL